MGEVSLQKMLSNTIEEFKSNFENTENIFTISAYSHQGLTELIEYVIKTLEKLPEIKRSEVEEFEIDKRNLREFKVEKIGNGLFEVKILPK